MCASQHAVLVEMLRTSTMISSDCVSCFQPFRLLEGFTVRVASANECRRGNGHISVGRAAPILDVARLLFVDCVSSDDSQILTFGDRFNGQVQLSDD